MLRYCNFEGCAKPFLTHRGGKPQKFCTPLCRTKEWERAHPKRRREVRRAYERRRWATITPEQREGQRASRRRWYWRNRESEKVKRCTGKS
jgi:hypothetical protein